VAQTADKLRDRFGFDAVKLARSLERTAEAPPRKKRKSLTREG
jgi:hypothetical protein